MEGNKMVQSNSSSAIHLTSQELVQWVCKTLGHTEVQTFARLAEGDLAAQVWLEMFPKSIPSSLIASSIPLHRADIQKNFLLLYDAIQKHLPQSFELPAQVRFDQIMLGNKSALLNLWRWLHWLSPHAARHHKHVLYTKKITGNSTEAATITCLSTATYDSKGELVVTTTAADNTGGGPSPQKSSVKKHGRKLIKGPSTKEVYEKLHAEEVEPGQQHNTAEEEGRNDPTTEGTPEFLLDQEEAQLVKSLNQLDSKLDRLGYTYEAAVDDTIA